MRVHSFPPVASAESRLLILGSMPGKASLRAGEYYAHRRNLFWAFVEACLGVAREAPYPDRLAALRTHGVALWDVLESCTRTSSLDSDIVESSVVVNPIPDFLLSHSRIELVCFNGAAAETLFRRHVLPALPTPSLVSLRRLPSTSPANASIPRDVKIREWRSALEASQAG